MDSKTTLPRPVLPQSRFRLTLGRRVQNYAIVLAADKGSPHSSSVATKIEAELSCAVEVELLATALARLRGCRAAIPLALAVMVDEVGGPGTVVSRLLQFRLRSPDIPVILLSKGFAVDDFSTVRLVICDVSLRLPLRSHVLGEAIQTAQANNSDWLDRLSERRRERRKTIRPRTALGKPHDLVITIEPENNALL